MLPSLRQRLILAGAILLGALGFLAARPYLEPYDLSTGISLFSARVAMPAALGIALVASLPAVVLAIFASATGHPLAGVFAMCMSLAVLAGMGGSVDGWFWRSPLPSEYGSLISEMVIWQTGIVLLILLIQKFREPIRKKFPALAFNDHLGSNTWVRLPGLTALLAGVISAAVGALLTFVLMRNTDTGQAVGAVLIAFTAGGLAAQSLFPQRNPIGILFSPALVAIISYVFAMLRYDSAESLLSALYANKLMAGLPGTCKVLPIFYASVGVAGCIMGIGMAQSIERSGKMSESPAGSTAAAGASNHGRTP